jgi:general secretion pathway protein E
MRMSLLVDPEGQVRRKAADLGLLEAQMTELKKIVEEERGVVLLGAQADGGRTTTLYSVLKMHDAYTKNVQLVETEPQDLLEGIRQNKWEAQVDGPEFSTLVRSILRRDPDIIGVAELPDANTAKEIAKADHERTRTYVSVRGDSVIPVLQGWCKLVADQDLAAKGLHGIMVQKLVRKLCANCKVAYQPSPEMVKKMGLPPDRVKQLFKKGGQVLIKNKPEVCPLCKGTGYMGLEGVFEVYQLTQDERTQVKAEDWNGLRTALRKRNLPTMQQAAIKKAIDGTTSVEEVMRVTAEAKPEGGAAPAAAQGAGGAGKPPAAPASA